MVSIKMKIPKNPLILMKDAYLHIFPVVAEKLTYWKKRAGQIPDPELRKQALDSISNKAFHCQGGSLMALLAQEQKDEAITFIVAYQTISDYLDNLCDRSTSVDPDDFTALHEAMMQALDLNADLTDYYRIRAEKEDGGYLLELVETCRSVLQGNPNYLLIMPHLKELCTYYCDLQIHKHVKQEERVPRLKSWFEEFGESLPQMTWYEFSACTGSTLGIFSMVSSSYDEAFSYEHASRQRDGYFPYIQGLHILLDYLIDQEEDRRDGELNFCFYYESEDALFARLNHFFNQSRIHTKNLLHPHFHQMIVSGLLGLYLSDRKVDAQKKVKGLANKLLRNSRTSRFFYYNGRFFRSLQKRE